MSKIIDVLRNAWAQIKTKVSTIHITSAIQVIDAISALASKVEVKAEELDAIISVLQIPEQYKSEVKAVLGLSIPVLKIIANEPKLKLVYDDTRLALATEVANIMSGKVHDIATIKADIQSVFTTEVTNLK